MTHRCLLSCVHRTLFRLTPVPSFVLFLCNDCIIVYVCVCVYFQRWFVRCGRTQASTWCWWNRATHKALRWCKKLETSSLASVLTETTTPQPLQPTAKPVDMGRQQAIVERSTRKTKVAVLAGGQCLKCMATAAVVVAATRMSLRRARAMPSVHVSELQNRATFQSG